MKDTDMFCVFPDDLQNISIEVGFDKMRQWLDLMLSSCNVEVAKRCQCSACENSVSDKCLCKDMELS